MRTKAVLLFVASATLACAAACSDSESSALGGAGSGPAASGPAAPAAAGGSSPAATPSGGAGGSATDASAGGSAPDAAPVFDPASCECFPGTTRWCDPADGTNWGKQPCGAGGTWGACAVVAAAPSGCDGQPFDEQCCVGGNVCCENKDGTDSTGPNGGQGGGAGGGAAGDGGAFDGSTSVGACDQIACPNAIASGLGFGRK